MRQREIFLRPSPIDKLARFAERFWWIAAFVFVAWAWWRLA